MIQDPYNSGAPSGASVTSQSRDRSSDPSPSTPVDQVKGAADGVAKGASSLAGQAKLKLTDTLDGQKGTAADLIEQLAVSVQRSGEQFEGRQDWIASAVGRGAVELNTLAGSLRDKDLGELMSEAQTFARRQPALFIGVALVVGFTVARFGKVVASDLSRNDLPTIPEVGDGQS
ncbi:hypothetical protein QCD71_20610 [Sphingomonas sp. PsM26]|jgi:hypothetical protein|nr:hypothetical protein [Sphingomonas sp. PsM26]